MDETELELEKNKELALDIIMNNIAKITQQYSIEKDKTKVKKLKEKVDILNKIKDEIYLGNLKIIDKVIKKYKKGIL